MRQELIGFLGSGVERHWMVYLIIGTEGYLLVASVDRARGCVDEVLYTSIPSVIRMAASFQDIIKTDQVATDVSVWISNTVSNPRLSGEVDHNLRSILLKYLIHQFTIRQITFYEGVVVFPYGFLDLFQSPLLNTHIIIVIEII